MRARRQSKGGRKNRSGGDAGGDLFSQELTAAVKQAFAGATESGSEGTTKPVDAEAPPPVDHPGPASTQPLSIPVDKIASPATPDDSPEANQEPFPDDAVTDLPSSATDEPPTSDEAGVSGNEPETRAEVHQTDGSASGTTLPHSRGTHGPAGAGGANQKPEPRPCETPKVPQPREAQTGVADLDELVDSGNEPETRAEVRQTDGSASGTTLSRRRETQGTLGNEPETRNEKPETHPDPIPARMLNEFVYCRRLFYYEHVEGVFVESADTVKGAAVHRRVDKGRGSLPEAGRVGPSEPPAQPAPDADEIHSRSVMLGSERLGAIAKMDLVEVTLDAGGGAASVIPVDYKVGSPREGDEGGELWDTDRMQLGVQCLILRDNGYVCDEGVIYYRGNKKRVSLPLTAELEAWVIAQIAAARVCAAGPIPPPLCDSPKCARCSLAPVCLPDETRMLSVPTIENYPLEDEDNATISVPPDDRHAAPTPRRLMAARDEKRALYLTTQGYRVGCNDAVIKVKEKDRFVEEVRVMDVCHVAIFGNIQMSTQAVQRLCDADIPVTWFSMGGWFYGITRGHSLKNVLLRIAQFRHAGDPAMCLRLAQQFVRGKIHNHRVLFMRNHEAPPERTKLRLGQAREDALATRSLEELLGVEGAAAGEYFAHFNGLLCQREDDDFLEGLSPSAPTNADTVAQFRFDFATRNRRPPTDPVNALLSLAYSLLAKECTLAAYAVGLDPYVGFYHQPRHGRPALALDIMEEFRPIIAESTVITAINNRFVSPADFVSAGRAVNLSATGRKQFIQCFEQRMNAPITHPVFDYKVCYRRAVELQFRILARVLTGEIPEYVPFLNR